MQKTVALFILLFLTFSYSPIHTNEWQSSGYQDSIAHIRNASGVPAVGAVLLLDGKIHFLGVSGIRKWGANVKTSTHDRFQLGSVTKPLTATLTAIFFAELADKTQLVGIAMSSKTGKPLAVFLGSIAGYALVTLISVIIGVTLAKYIRPEWIRYAGPALLC